MTDPELIEKKLAEIETYLRELRTLAEPARMRTDAREERFTRGVRRRPYPPPPRNHFR